MLTTATKPAPTCTPARTPLTLACLHCGSADNALTIDLNGLHDEDADTIRCDGCEAEYSLASVRDAVKRWRAVLSWIDSRPNLDAE